MLSASAEDGHNAIDLGYRMDTREKKERNRGQERQNEEKFTAR
jgi:hypothetical protein